MMADPPTLQALADECLAYAMTHGVTMLRHAPLAAGTVAKSSSIVTVAPSAASDSGPAIFQVPLTLLPYRVPARLYEQVRALVPELNLLYERVSRDRAWLTSTLSEAVKDDAFISRLLALLNTIAESPSVHYAPQTAQLSINRSDYMLSEEDSPDPPLSAGAEFEPGRFGKHARLLQVEFNTISAGAGSLCNKVAEMHAFLMDRFFPEPTGEGGEVSAEQSGAHASGVRLNLPANPLISNLSSSMARAHRLFVSQRASVIPKGTTPVVLFVVQPREANMADQRHLEYSLWREHRVAVRRMTLAEVATLAVRDEATGLLWIEGASGSSSSSSVSARSSPLGSAPARQLVSLVYFRAGYTPRDFPTGSEVEWTALETIERSVAIKAPSIAYHLSGTKKVQQVLATAGAVERFLPDDAPMVARIRSCFAGLWPVNAESIAAALANPARFVLKPQREGGGNNLFHGSMVALLQSSSLTQLAHYILMEKIGGHVAAAGAGVSNEVQAAPILKNGQLVVLEQSESELGMLGVMLTELEPQQGNAAAVAAGAAASSLSAAPVPIRIHQNDFGGYLLRTKSASSNEGGLISGAGAIGSIVLVP